LSGNVAKDAGGVCDNASALGETIKEALCTSKFCDPNLSPGHIGGEKFRA